MAYDPKPSTWLGAGYSSSAGSHNITLQTGDASSNKTLARLTDALADPTTGEIRSIYYAICEQAIAAWIAQGGTPGSLPSKMTISVTNSTGPDGKIKRTFSFAFILDGTSTPVTAE